jgi:hypothetical protein
VTPGTATLQLVTAANAPAPSMEAIEPFAQRFHFGDAAGDGGVAALAYSAAPPNEPPVVKLRPPGAEQRDGAANAAASLEAPADASTSQPPAVEATLGGSPVDAARAAKVEAAPPEEKSGGGPLGAETEEVAHQTVTSAPVGEPADAPTADAQAAAASTDVATIERAAAEPSSVEAPLVEQTDEPGKAPDLPAAAPTNPEPAAKAAEKKAPHKARAAYAGTQPGKAKSASTDTDFQTAPPWPQAQSQHAKATSRASSDSATGGPFVSPSGR